MPRVDAERRGQRRSMAALSRLSLLLWAHLASRDDEMVGNVERRNGGVAEWPRHEEECS